MADSKRRGRTIWIAQLLLVLAAAALWTASRLPWVTIHSSDELGPAKTVTLTGASWSTALLPLAALLVAAAVAAVAVRGWPLRGMAVLVGLASLATSYLAISLWAAHDVATRAANLADVSVHGRPGPAERHHPGAVITLAAALFTLLGAALLLRSAASGRAGASKYAAPAARRASAKRVDADALPGMSERVIWDALDEGRDPTAQSSDPDIEGR